MIDIKDKDFIKEFKKCKIGAIDIAYMGTKDSKGANAGKKALKFIFFNEKDVFSTIKEEDKYFYISSKLGGRELIKLVDDIDIIHILAKFSMQLFPLLQTNFRLNEEVFLKLRKQNNIKLKGDELIEFIAFSSFKDHYDTYLILSSNKKLKINLFDMLIDYRYKKEFKKDLDNFSGIKESGLAASKLKKYQKQYDIIDETYKDIRNLVNNS